MGKEAEGEKVQDETQIPEADDKAEKEFFGALEGKDEPEAESVAEDSETEEVSDKGSEKPAAKFKSLLKEFASPEELESHARELEKRQIELEAKLAARDELLPHAKSETNSEDAAATADEDDYSAEEFFVDPKAALRKAEARIERKLRGEQEKVASNRNFWDSFYNDFDDLRGNEDIVELVLAKNRGRWEKLPTEKARAMLATEVRGRLSTIRGGGTSGETLPKGGAATAGATGATVSKTAVAPQKPASFVDQLKAMREKRRKKAG